MIKYMAIEEAEFQKLMLEVSLLRETITTAVTSSSLSWQQRDEPFKTRKQLAAELEITTQTLHDWRKEGLPYYKPKGRVYFLKSEVIKFMAERGKIKKKG